MKEITILRTWKGEEFELDIKYEEFLLYEEEQKMLGYDGMKLDKYRRYLKFSSIEDRIGKTRYLELSFKEQKRLYSEKEKKESRQRSQKILKQIYPNLRKNFLIKRDEILKRLAFEEKKFDLDTTIDKLEKLKTLELQQQVLLLKNK